MRQSVRRRSEAYSFRGTDTRVRESEGDKTEANEVKHGEVDEAGVNRGESEGEREDRSGGKGFRDEVSE